MSAIGNVIGKAVDSAFGKESGTTLQDFLSKFSSSEGKWVDMIDPFASFDVKMKFYPNIYGNHANTDLHGSKDKNWYESLKDTATSAAKSAVKSLANNVTGGLIGSIMNGQIKIDDKRNEFASTMKKGTQSFLEYLAAANLLVGSEDWVGENAGQSSSPLELQLGLYCQEVTLPNIEVPPSQSSVVNQFGEFPINGMIMKTDTNVVTMKILNTKVPLHERIFYPWLREVTLPYWSYDSQPYTTATITVDFTKHSDVSYVFCGCRPQKIIMQQAHQDASSNITRDVSFLFDYMFINSSLTTIESLEDKLLSTGKSLLNSASKLVNA